MKRGKRVADPLADRQEVVSPNHWSRQEPDGLAQYERVDRETGEVVMYRAAGPNKAAPWDSPGGRIPQSRRHGT